MNCKIPKSRHKKWLHDQLLKGRKKFTLLKFFYSKTDIASVMMILCFHFPRTKTKLKKLKQKAQEINMTWPHKNQLFET